MPDNGNKASPVRTLTVKNFSVVKEAKLEFGKITVLIGPQASGKSLLCKLAFFLEKHVIDIAVDALLRTSPLSLEEFANQIPREFVARFPMHTWQNDGVRIEFTSGAYLIYIVIQRSHDEINFEFDFSLEFKRNYSRLAAIIPQMQFSDAASRTLLNKQVRAQLNLLQHDGFIDDAVYVPATRALFANPLTVTSAVANTNLDPFTRDFALELAVGGSWVPNPIAGEQVLQSIEHVRNLVLDILGGEAIGRDSSLQFKRLVDGLSIPLAYLSSGTQELLPLGDVIRQLATRQRDRVIFPRKDDLPGFPDAIVESRPLVYLEEPESNIFPSTQYQLVRLISFLSGAPRLEFSWVITTHSPYVLSSFNNLLEAGQAARNNPTLHDQIAKIVPEQYWIKEGDFKAYAIENGELKSILNDSGFVEGNYLDQVSEVIGNEFDELLRLEYEHTKAS